MQPDADVRWTTTSFTHSGNAIRARSIPVYRALALSTIVAGLASRSYQTSLPTFVGRYAGDTLWAAMVFWLLALVWRRGHTTRIAAVSLAVAFAIEVSQVFHATWIDSIRASRVGSLVLGSGFLWSDLGCYAIGVTIAAGIDALLITRDKSPGDVATSS